MRSLNHHSRANWQQGQLDNPLRKSAPFRFLAAILVVSLTVGTFAQNARADDDDDDGESIPFDDTGIIFETNLTDRDTGIQISLDGDPWGAYEFEGETVEEVELVGEATLTHVLPYGPEVDATVGTDSVVITWEEVATIIDPTTEDCVEDEDGLLIIEGYQVIVENDNTFTVELPDDATQVTVPTEFLEPDTEYSFEVLAIEESGNQTITESDFETMP